MKHQKILVQPKAQPKSQQKKCLSFNKRRKTQISYSTMQSKQSSAAVKRESLSFESIQQSVLIYLLCKEGYSFTFRRPERVAVKTLQYFSIVDVMNKQSTCHLGTAIDNVCNTQYDAEYNENMKPNEVKSLKRRRDLNKSSLAMNYLVEECTKMGYFFDKRATKSAKKTVQMPRITTIFRDRSKVYDIDQISQLGSIVNHYIISLRSNDKLIVLNSAPLIQYVNYTIQNQCKSEQTPYENASQSTNELANQSVQVSNESSSEAMTYCMEEPTFELIINPLYIYY